MEYLGSLESTQEARVALGYASGNSYVSFVLSKLIIILSMLFTPSRYFVFQTFAALGFKLWLGKKYRWRSYSSNFGRFHFLSVTHVCQIFIQLCVEPMLFCFSQFL